MPSATENRLNRKQTEAFIAFDPQTVILNHAETVRTPAGGYVQGEPMSRPPVTGRLIDIPQGAPVVRRQLDGEDVYVTQELVLPWDAVVERGDWFFVEGRKYEVVWVPEGVTREYEVKAQVVFRG